MIVARHRRVSTSFPVAVPWRLIMSLLPVFALTCGPLFGQALEAGPPQQGSAEAEDGYKKEIAALKAQVDALLNTDAQRDKEIEQLRTQVEALRKKEPDRDQDIQGIQERLEKTETETAKLLGTNMGEKLSIYGYWDTMVGWNRYSSNTWGVDQYHAQTFLSYRLRDNIRILTDVTYEHGTQHEGPEHPGDGPEVLGEVKVRSFAECAFSDKFKLNVGKFLTPFGEYNLYHDATVVYTSVGVPRSLYAERVIGFDAGTPPKPILGRLFAKEGAGVWFWGNLNLPRDYRLEYNLYGINGRGGLNEFQVDDNNNKGIGAKLLLTCPSGLKFGVSHYSDRHPELVAQPLAQTTALQAQYTHGPLILSGEYMRASLPGTHANAYYGQVEYEFGKLIPYYRYDYYSDDGVLNPDERIHTLGLNYALSPGLRLKAEHGFYSGARDVFQSSLSAAF